ncbi:shadow of prion protein 2 precursor [Danio rerio]|uniref:Shadow of prion protein 2 n=1 Tax=Danio rerio TaxID=7955 RepID=Q65CB0_DANRE|nr:shadow of prion protein 2 precursor [Danio rerio]AAI71551.1 Shadow of prion protein 2 [Danio rerio]CAE47354.1 Sho2 protein precursor [Danio rerio]|eukprot:NP_001007781.1 shadow of prion protein 2 precursor [Danio rerio]
MLGNQKLLIIWVWMLLLASLCPCFHCKRGFGGRGMSKGAAPAKAPPSQSKGSSSRQGLKLAGAAAAGAIGGAAIGYGLGSLGRPRYGHNGYSDGYHQPVYNQSHRGYYGSTGSSEHMGSLLITLGTVAHVVIMWA